MTAELQSISSKKVVKWRCLGNIVKKFDSKPTKETVIMTKKEKPFVNVALFIIYKLG